MRKSIRAALVGCAVISTLAFASTALAAYTSPKLVVSSLTPQATGSGGPVRIAAVVANSDDPTARVQIYVPTGYQISTPVAGTKLGDVTATASAVDLAGAILPLTGDLQAVAPNVAGATQCGVAASQYWNLHLTAAGQTLDIPMYVVAANANEQAAGYQAKLVVCLPPPDVPSGTPGRAVFGAKLLSASFGVSAITQPVATGDFRWTSIFTPYNPGKGTPNALGSVETQAIRHIPTQLVMNVKRAKVTTFTTRKIRGKKVRVKHVRTRVTFSSTLTENGAAATGAITTVAALLALVIGGLSVVNTMLMAVTERVREIGLKKAIGARTGNIVREFVAESTTIGVVGGVLGFAIGAGITLLLGNAAGPGGLFLITPRLAILALGFAVVLGAVAGVLPAYRASRLDPVIALRSVG